MQAEGGKEGGTKHSKIIFVSDLDLSVLSLAGTNTKYQTCGRFTEEECKVSLGLRGTLIYISNTGLSVSIIIGIGMYILEVSWAGD